MSESSSNPVLLFTPEPSSGTSKSRYKTRDNVDTPLPFFISPPFLSAAQKKQYKPLPESSLAPEVDIPIDEVIGEHKENRQLYYFARFDGGIAHKFPADDLLASFPKLVEIYKRKKERGTLEDFDPTASYVHSFSRVKLKINITNIKSTTRNTGSRDIIVISDSEDEFRTEDQSESEDEVQSDSYSEPSIKTRRSERTKARPQLPFSPKKTRSQRINVIDGSESESTGNEILAGFRRSTRNKRTTNVRIRSPYDEDDTGSEMNDSDYDYRRRNKNKKVNTRRIQKALPPAYGSVRDISELEGDPFPEDEENIPLRRHRDICEKCHMEPSHRLIAKLLKTKGKKKKRKQSTDDEFEESDSEETYKSWGGWVRCLRCPVAAHWRCLAAVQRDEVLRAIKEKDHETSTELSFDITARRALDFQEITDFVCGACNKFDVCMGCMKSVSPEDSNSGDENIHQLIFRCFTCKRPAHYTHMQWPAGFDDKQPLGEVATYYQRDTSWLCADCSSYQYSLDKIIAWRLYPPDANEPRYADGDAAHYKENLPREYLVKWVGRSYKRMEWVPHMWLVSTSSQKLKNFLLGGTKVELLQEPIDDTAATDAEGGDTSFQLGASSTISKVTHSMPVLPSGSMPDAEHRIPPAWKTVDRILDVVLWYPQAPATRLHVRSNKGVKKDNKVSSLSIKSFKVQQEEERASVHDRGEQPSLEFAGTIIEWEQVVEKKVTMENANLVAWAFIKWVDLGYEDATWDTPPLPNESGYNAFLTAFRRYIDSREVVVPKFSRNYAQHFDKREKDGYRKYVLKDPKDLDLGQDSKYKLMPFQVDGFNWLNNNWWRHQHCILADEMGLGKTVQIATFLGNIAQKWKAFPALVVVPNSTITNWVREFERWAPKLRVVPYYGEKKAREIIQKYELFHSKSRPGDTPAKFHVLVTTYETLTKGQDFSIFKNQPRWEVLVVDEGQRLKSDSSLLFKKLNELNSIHRIIMTGTPLNNNIRELFNLMNFLDPEEWKDLEALEKEHEELTEELVKQLHTRLRPYFLRRVKSEVLQLPPKNEVIVPVSMAPLQKEVYRSILSHNADLLKNLSQSSKLPGFAAKGRINNILMQLRKCLQHPYLYAEDIEPSNLSPQESHDKLIDASAKLRFLKVLLPKLKERGHRVLLFSQFVIALDVIEDFLRGEGHKYLRLDGNTKGTERQKGMDEFNRPGSDVFIYLLTTRAGGVGINLFSADTVIIFDPDFNPHQDLQAIARAYRYGQQKTCLVFKLMVKESAEERIMQIGKKKLVLDHLIVQKMDDDEENGGENVQSILTYGAQALFDQGSKDISYSDQDIEKLIEKTEKEGDQDTEPTEGGLSFSFAKVWEAGKDALEEVGDDDQTDSWAQTLQMITVERDKQLSKEIALSGRGARRKAADIAKTKMQVEEVFAASGEKKDNQSRRSQPAESDGSAYRGSAMDSDSDASDIIDVDEEFQPTESRRREKLNSGNITSTSNGISESSDVFDCGLCGGRHGSGFGACFMTDQSENLAEFREMLILHADDEPWEERSAAILAIDEILARRGDLELIAGQPLYPLPNRIATDPSALKKPRMDEISRMPSTTVTPSAAYSAPTISLTGVQPPTIISSVGQLPAQGPSTQQPSMNMPIASSSKRMLTPPPIEVSKKKARISLSACPVCGGHPHQSLAKDCPAVLEGPVSIVSHINRLEKNPGMTTTVEILRKILKKKKRQESS
ncbi:SNF2 family N-terminal domain-containing protein [Cyathus striatus]|nr:SNF2 family N-terminal domain-containing protein [Cyathus striatus]